MPSNVIDANPSLCQSLPPETKLNKPKPSKEEYGEHKNVLLTVEEYEKLKNVLGENNTKVLIEELSAYMASRGKRYASHYATIQTWARRRVQEHNNKDNKRSII